MTEEQIIHAAMYLLAKQQGVDTRFPKRVRAKWNQFHKVVQNAHIADVRKVLRAIDWAKKHPERVFYSMAEVDAAFFPNIEKPKKRRRTSQRLSEDGSK